jgi:hypothetical protein
MSTVTVEVGMPHPGELERIVNEWFDAQPLEITYAVFEGDAPEPGEPRDLDEAEQKRVIATACRYLWLKAARKRADRP